MKVNKWIIIWSVFVASGCVLSLFIFKENTMESNVAISLLTGTIISTLTATIYYLNERQKILCEIRKAIPDIYINLKLVHNLTGSILPQIIYVQQLDGVNYRRILSLANLNIEFIQNCHTNEFSCFRKKGKTACAVASFLEYANGLYNLKSCLDKLECAALDADILQNQLYIKRLNNQFISVEEDRLLSDKRNFVNIRTAKTHEYEASLLLQLDTVAENFFKNLRMDGERKKSH